VESLVEAVDAFAVGVTAATMVAGSHSTAGVALRSPLGLLTTFEPPLALCDEPSEAGSVEGSMVEDEPVVVAGGTSLMSALGLLAPLRTAEAPLRVIADWPAASLIETRAFFDPGSGSRGLGGASERIESISSKFVAGSVSPGR
jgi:hypothetical protein